MPFGRSQKLEPSWKRLPGLCPKFDDAGAPHSQSGERCHPHPKSGRNGDGGSRT